MPTYPKQLAIKLSSLKTMILKAQEFTNDITKKNRAFFLVVGSGSDYKVFKSYLIPPKEPLKSDDGVLIH